MKPEILNYLQKIDGGDWSTKEMKQELYNLVSKGLKQFDGQELLSVQLGVFAGATLFPLAHAHKDIKNGKAIGIDAWHTAPCLEGRNHDDVNKFWRNMDFNRVFNSFTDIMEMDEWSYYVEYKRGRFDEVVNEFADDSITLLHQDGAHNKEQIIKELELWSPKLKVGGYWIISAANWGEAVDGYLQLPKFGFELVKDYEGWEIWRKKGELDNVRGKEYNIQLIENQVVFEADSLIEQTCKESDYNRKHGGMNLSGLNIQPIMIYIPDTESWVEKFKEAKQHFESIGIKPIYIPAIYGQGFGVAPTSHEYNLDNPNGHHNIGVAYTSLNLTMYMVYNIMANLDATHFMFLEGDTRCNPDFLKVLESELTNVPKDFDFLFIGSCCASDKKKRLVGGNVYECIHNHNRPIHPCQMPLGGNCYIVAKKALPKFIETQRDLYAPTDLNIGMHTLPFLKTYIIYPRIVEQKNNPLPQ